MKTEGTLAAVFNKIYPDILDRVDVQLDQHELDNTAVTANTVKVT